MDHGGRGRPLWCLSLFPLTKAMMDNITGKSTAELGCNSTLVQSNLDIVSVGTLLDKAKPLYGIKLTLARSYK